MADVIRSVSGHFNAGVDGGTLQKELQALTLASTTYQSLYVLGDNCVMVFSLSPSVPDLALIDGVVAAHTNTPETDVSGDADRILQNPIQVSSSGLVETSSTTLQTAVSVDVTGLVGVHRIAYDAGITQGQGGIGLAEIGLQRVGGPIVSGLFSWRRSSTSEIQNANDAINIILDGSPQTYAVIYHTSHPSTTMLVIGARIELWRVS